MERARPATEARLGEAGTGPPRFEEFFEEEAPTLFQRLCLVTGSRAEAEDVMQDAFIRLYERWDRVSGLEDPQGYLYRTAFNVFRRRARRAALAMKRQLRLAPAANEFDRAENRAIVDKGLTALTPRQRAALVLTELMDLSSEEAGRLLGVKPATVRALASQGRAAMRGTLGDLDE